MLLVFGCFFLVVVIHVCYVFLSRFPLIHFTQLFGILQLFAGVGSMLQYGLFEWFQAYQLAPMHVRNQLN